MKKFISILGPAVISLFIIVAAHTAFAANVLPNPEPPFKGKIGFSAKDSQPDWPEPIKAPKDAPNVVVILLDDMGFGNTSTFGGTAQTPELDKLASQGVRYNNFNTTAICSPTRAALLTGRNHHRVGFGGLTQSASGYPGYNSVWKKSTASMAEILRQNGYSTTAFGKWHNTPDWEVTPTGPFDRWPTGLGFDYFYGFMGSGGENQWEPTNLYRNTTPVDPPATAEQGYHFTTDMTDDAIRWLQTHESLAPEKPYFLYFATGAVHAPHHAPKEWIDRYRGKFDRGWDTLREEIFARQKKLGVIPANTKLTPRPGEIPAWNSLSADQKKLYARQMEVYAGFVAHTDAEVGRLLKTVRSGSNADNTLIMYIVGDNGAGGLSGIDGFASGATTVWEQLQHIDELGSAKIPWNMYSAGWAWAGSTPFQWWKGIASHFGGTRNPLIVSWPAGIKNKGGLRSQFTHVNDVAATIYDVAGIAFPSTVNGVTQQALDGISFAQTFDQASVPSNHPTQYFEMFGNRAIYQNGWVAAARRQWQTDFTQDRWELYHVAKDFSQADDLAEKYPEKLKELQAVFDQEARKNDVYPLGWAVDPDKPSLLAGKQEIVYSPETYRIPTALLPGFAESSYRLTATAVIPPDGAKGILVSNGDRVYGFVLYVKDGHVIYENRSGVYHDVMTSKTTLPPGGVTIAFEFDRDKEKNTVYVTGLGSEYSGTGRLYINGQLSAEVQLSSVQMARDAALFIGRATGSPVSNAFVQPFAFTGTLNEVKVEWK